jgi:hypothetical protein
MQSQPRSSNRSTVLVLRSPESNASLLIFIGRRRTPLTLTFFLLLLLLFLLIQVALFSEEAKAQESATVSPATMATMSPAASGLPFEVINPKHKKWPEAEAGRIYMWACDLLARSIRPEKPPQLHPKFRLVLGTDDDEFVRDSAATEIHLKTWNPEKFAQGVVVVALRELVPRTDLARLAHQSVSLAGATLDVSPLREH